MHDEKVKELFYMSELEDFFSEQELRDKRLKLRIRYFLSEFDEYLGNNMKIEGDPIMKKKQVIKTIHSVEGKGHSKNISNLF